MDHGPVTGARNEMVELHPDPGRILGMLPLRCRDRSTFRPKQHRIQSPQDP